MNSQSGIMINNIIGTNLNCYEDNTGSINLEVSAGTFPYNFLWSNGGFSEDIDGLPAGNYFVTATDADGCSAQSNIVITQPDELLIDFAKTDATCGLSNGSINLTVQGGTIPYSYVWDGTNDTSPNPTNLGVGLYAVTVYDGSGCSVETSISIDTPTDFSVTENIIDNLCYGDSMGSIDLQVMGGNPPLNYLWSNGMTSSSISNLIANTYIVTITDSDNCMLVNSFEINEPTPILIAGTSTSASCGQANGCIDLMVSGGTLPYNFVWSSLGGNTPSPCNLFPGQYAVTVTDANNCSSYFEINVDAPNALNLSTTSTGLQCFGDTNGCINLEVNGGIAPFVFDWSNGAVVEDICNLSSGNYSVTVTDATNCSVITTQEIIEPTSIQLTEIISPATCGFNNGSIEIQTNVPSNTLSYSWSNGTGEQNLVNVFEGIYQLTITDVNLCTTFFETQVPASIPLDYNLEKNDITCHDESNGSIDVQIINGEAPYTYLWNTGNTSSTLNNLTTGSYSVTVTDNFGCTSTASEIISEPTILESAAINPTNINCNGNTTGAIVLDVTGGTQPYDVIWNNGMTGIDINNLPSGIYSTTITDFNGCSVISETTIQEPTPLLLICDVTNSVMTPNGNEGTATINFEGGTPPYIISWSGVTTGTSNQNVQGEIELENLTAGDYTVSVLDNNNCLMECLFSIQEFQCDLDLTFDVISLECYGDNSGEINLQTIGGTAPFEILWNNSVLNGMENIQNLSSGDYSVTITDNNDCVVTEIISVFEPEELEVVFDTECVDEKYGMLSINSITGGNGDYQFSTDGQAFQSINNFPEIISELAGGNYYLTVQDNNGCQDDFSFFIQTATDLSVELGEDISIELGEKVELDGIANFNPTDIVWKPVDLISSNSLSTSFIPLESMEYIMSAYDESGCFTMDTINVFVQKNYKVFVPNAFSPDGDGFNDFFSVFGGQDVEEISELLIFSRWGELVFQRKNFIANEIIVGWDGRFKGKQLDNGVYIYQVKVRFIDGEVKLFKGDITIVK